MYIRISNHYEHDDVTIQLLRRRVVLAEKMLRAGLDATEGEPKGAGLYVVGSRHQSLKDWRNGVQKYLSS